MSLAHGIQPAVLTHRGLAAAVEELADRAPVPVHVDIPDERYPDFAESATYLVVVEALTNVAKYACATTVRIAATGTPDALVTVRDDGVDGASIHSGNGASIHSGTGLAGLVDRLAAFDGTLSIDSPRGDGTHIRAEIPLRPAPARRTSDPPA